MPTLKDSYDISILGSGPAACSCALRCAELGFKVVIFCGDKNLCVEADTYNPQLTLDYLQLHCLLESAKLFETLINNSNSHGINLGNVTLELNQTLARKNKLILDINKNITANFLKHKIELINANAKLVNSKTVEVRLDNTLQRISTKYIILATDSKFLTIPNITIDHTFILDVNDALNLKEVPKRIAILGAGVNGLEIAGIWNRFGSEVTLLDAQDTFLDILDHQISRQAYQIFSDQNLEIRLGARVLNASIKNKKVTVEYQDIEGIHAIKVDKLIISPGRSPNSEHIATPDANLLLDENGFIHVDEKLRTNLPDVYAIGDLTLYGPMLRHKGMAEGIYLAESLAGVRTEIINYKNIPNIIYTEPEIAWVGDSEQKLKSLGKRIDVSVHQLNQNYKAIIENKTSGIAKIIINSDSKEILGFHLISSKASEIISEIALSMEFSANVEDFSRFIYSHPSYSELIFDISKTSALINHP